MEHKTKIHPLAIKPELLNDVWPQIECEIVRALKHDPLGESPDEIRARIESGQYLLILMLRGSEVLAVLTLELFERDGEKVCNIVTAGGNSMELWRDSFLYTVKVLAKEQGASKLMLNGRPGWLRYLKPHGFELRNVVIEAQI